MNQETRIELGKKLKKQRQAADLSLMDVSMALDKSHSWLARVERGGIKKITQGQVDEILNTIQTLKAARAVQGPPAWDPEQSEENNEPEQRTPWPGVDDQPTTPDPAQDPPLVGPPIFDKEGE